MRNSLGHLTEADIRARCTEASFERGQGYYGLGGLPIKGGCQRGSNVIYLIKSGNPPVATRRPPGPGELSTQPDLQYRITQARRLAKRTAFFDLSAWIWLRNSSEQRKYK
jgi:hypothetical protein